ncbi:MAG: ribonuclease J [Candidatus Saccharibacteria bacterium]
MVQNNNNEKPQPKAARNSDKPRTNKPGGRSPKQTSGSAATPAKTTALGISNKNRGAAMRMQRRNQDDAQRAIEKYQTAENQPRPKGKRANFIADSPEKLKMTFLGGLEDVGEKNMAIIEWQNDAIILDCGNNLGVELPGVNYEINDVAYLKTIKHKIRGYVITHGHLDHIGGLKHIVPMFPAPIFGSAFTIGVVGKSFEDAAAETGVAFTPELNVINIDGHEKIKLGEFFVEFIRVTHSIPDPTAVCIETPVGRIIATGDFRLDPEPLDHMPSDITRLRELGDQGVLALLSDSSYADVEGRTPTEDTLQKSFHDIISHASGRIFVAVFSSNINRIQMIINAAAETGRKVAMDGRGMLSYAEVAVRQGILKVPKGTIISMQQSVGVPDDQLLVICTGGQGEPRAALQRMSEGDHKFITLKPGDTVVISSSPIPGNEIRYDQISNRLSLAGVHLFRHPTHELDGCGPLHVSGHAKRDELRDMILLTRPKFFIPVHGGALRRRYHGDVAINEGWKRKDVLLPNNGDSVLFTAKTAEAGNPVPHGSLLVDQNGTIVNGIVVRDRLMLSEEGIISVIVTVDRKSNQLLTSPDIISRGFIHLRDSEELMNDFRDEIRRAVRQRFGRLELDRFKAEFKDHIVQFLFQRTGRSPIVIPVVNVVGGRSGTAPARRDTAPAQSKEDVALAEQKRFQEMRKRLLSDKSA